MGVIKSWADAGKPGKQEDVPQFVSFQESINIIGPILKYVGIDEALSNAAVAKEEFDPGRESFDEFIQNWAVILGNKKIYNSEVLSELEKFPREVLPARVRKGLLEGDINDIFLYFRENRGKVFSGGLRIKRGKTHGRRYWVVTGPNVKGAEEQDEEKRPIRANLTGVT